MFSGVIYGLFDPRDPSTLRYVGQTSKNPDRRLVTHVQSSLRGERGHKSNWIRSLDRDDVQPCIRVLESDVLSQEELDALEIKWIHNLRAAGTSLTNMMNGGLGSRDCAWSRSEEWTDEMRLAMSAKMKDWADNFKSSGGSFQGSSESITRRVESRSRWLDERGGREELSKIMREVWRDPERSKNLRAAVESEERRLKIQETAKKTYADPELRRKIGEAVCQGMTDDGKERIAIATRARHGYSEPIGVRPCAVCAQEFLPSRRSKKTCSEKCWRSLARSKRLATLERRRNESQSS